MTDLYLQTAAIGYGGRSGVRIPPRVKEFYRTQAVCAGCSQRIHYPTLPMAVRGISTFHPSCARRHDVIQRSAPTQAPRIIGAVFGCAVPLATDCGVRIADVTQHERFELGAFDASLERGGSNSS